MTIGEYTFDGVYNSTENLQDKSGVYAIICQKGDKYYIIDVGESANVKTRVQNHDRKDCWKKNCQEIIVYAVLYTPNLQQLGRMEIEQKIRKKFDPFCGKQ